MASFDFSKCFKCLNDPLVAVQNAPATPSDQSDKDATKVLPQMDTNVVASVVSDDVKQVDDKSSLCRPRPSLEAHQQSIVVFSNFRDAETADTRLCLLCSLRGDHAVCGRLLSMDASWVHVNCLLWSGDAYMNGNLIEPCSSSSAVSSASPQANASLTDASTKSLCSLCGQEGGGGGSLIPCNNDSCQLVGYHFNCAHEAGCRFCLDANTGTYSMYCRKHSTFKGKQQAANEEEFDKSMLTSLIVNVQNETYRSKHPRPRFAIEDNDNKKHSSLSRGRGPFLLVGSLCVEKLGEIESAACDFGDYVCPVGYTCTRLYWSTHEIGKKCLYTCRVRFAGDLQLPIKVEPKRRSSADDEISPAAAAAATAVCQAIAEEEKETKQETTQEKEEEEEDTRCLSPLLRTLQQLDGQNDQSPVSGSNTTGYSNTSMNAAYNNYPVNTYAMPYQPMLPPPQPIHPTYNSEPIDMSKAGLAAASASATATSLTSNPASAPTAPTGPMYPPPNQTFSNYAPNYPMYSNYPPYYLYHQPYQPPPPPYGQPVIYQPVEYQQPNAPAQQPMYGQTSAATAAAPAHPPMIQQMPAPHFYAPPNTQQPGCFMAPPAPHPHQSMPLHHHPMVHPGFNNYYPPQMIPPPPVGYPYMYTHAPNMPTSQTFAMPHAATNQPPPPQAVYIQFFHSSHVKIKEKLIHIFLANGEQSIDDIDFTPRSACASKASGRSDAVISR